MFGDGQARDAGLFPQNGVEPPFTDCLGHEKWKRRYNWLPPKIALRKLEECQMPMEGLRREICAKSSSQNLSSYLPTKWPASRLFSLQMNSINSVSGKMR